MKYSTADDLPIILKEFLNHIYVVKNKSSLTIDEYALDLKMFLRFLKRQKALVPSSEEFDKIDITDVDIDFLKNVTLMDAYAFLSYCKNERNNDSAARARKVTSIRMFYKYLTVQRMFFKENPMLELETPKLKKSQPKYLTLDESLKLLGSVDGKHKERDYCILVLFLNCGLRLSELVSINYNDIRDNNTITITGKGNKQRTIYLNDASKAAIKNYMAVRPTDALKEKDNLIDHITYPNLINALNSAPKKQRIELKIHDFDYQCAISRLPFGTALFFVDITAMKNSQKMREEFFSSVSHELKTPITAIRGYSELLSQGFINDENQKKMMLSKIQTEVTNMSSLINDILMLSRLDSDDLIVENLGSGHRRLTAVPYSV